MNTSFEEKSVWIQLVALALTLVAYIGIASKMAADGITELPAYAPLLGTSVVLLVTLLIVGYIIAALAGNQGAPDERDRLIGWRAESNSSWILCVGILAAICGMIIAIEIVNIAHFLMATLFISAMAKLGFQIIYYRKGMTA